MFISLNNDSELTSRYIKKVTYNLHKSFVPNVVTVEEPPFLLARNGWGRFIVKCDVEL